MEMVKMINSGIRFLLELCLLAAISYWGFKTHSNLWLKLLLGVGLPLVVAALWGLFVAPKAVLHLPNPIHTLVELLLLSLGPAALFLSAQPTLGWIYAGLLLVNKVLLVILKQ